MMLKRRVQTDIYSGPFWLLAQGKNGRDPVHGFGRVNGGGGLKIYFLGRVRYDCRPMQ